MKVALVLGEVFWEAELASYLGHPSSKLKVARRCVDGIDALAAIKVHNIEVVVVTESTLRIDADVISQISNSGVAVVAISNSDKHWQAIGINHVVPLDLAQLHLLPQQINDVLSESSEVSVQDSPTGKLVCVASFGGGVGRSFIARELAYQNSKLGRATVFVEADTYGPSLVQDLNLTQSSSDLLHVSQSRIFELSPELAPQSLAIIAPNLAVIPGISDIALWPQLHKSNLEQLWSCLVRDFDVVVDVGPQFPNTQSELSNVTFLDRDTSARTALAKADTLVLCATASQVSVARLINGLIENQSQIHDVEIKVVINRCFEPSANSTKGMIELIKRHTGIADVIAIELDPQALSQIETNQDFLAKLNPKHSINKKTQLLAQNCLSHEESERVHLQQVQLDRINAA